MTIFVISTGALGSSASALRASSIGANSRLAFVGRVSTVLPDVQLPIASQTSSSAVIVAILLPWTSAFSPTTSALGAPRVRADPGLAFKIV